MNQLRNGKYFESDFEGYYLDWYFFTHHGTGAGHD